MGEDLGCRNIQKHGEWTVLQNSILDKGKGIREETINFCFKLNIVLQDLYQADDLLLEIKAWKQKIPSVYVKSFSKTLFKVVSFIFQRELI